MSDEKHPTLEDAYSLQTPEDSKDLYRQWAETYDESFSRAFDYLLPQHVAERYSEKEGESPILDVGAGTGLVAKALKVHGRYSIEGLDISQEMLAIAKTQNLYDAYIEGDLTKNLELPDNTYGGVISAGTFTHGHVGPDAIDELLRISQPDAQFVLAVNAKHFEANGFGAKFSSLHRSIHDFDIVTRNIYGPTAQKRHLNDLSHIVSFKKS